MALPLVSFRTGATVSSSAGGGRAVAAPVLLGDSVSWPSTRVGREWVLACCVASRDGSGTSGNSTASIGWGAGIGEALATGVARSDLCGISIGESARPCMAAGVGVGVGLPLPVPLPRSCDASSCTWIDCTGSWSSVSLGIGDMASVVGAATGVAGGSVSSDGVSCSALAVSSASVIGSTSAGPAGVASRGKIDSSGVGVMLLSTPESGSPGAGRSAVDGWLGAGDICCTTCWMGKAGVSEGPSRLRLGTGSTGSIFVEDSDDSPSMAERQIAVSRADFLALSRVTLSSSEYPASRSAFHIRLSARSSSVPSSSLPDSKAVRTGDDGADSYRLASDALEADRAGSSWVGLAAFSGGGRLSGGARPVACSNDGGGEFGIGPVEG